MPQATPALTPADVHRLFGDYFTAGDMEGLLSLYEADAVLLPRPGEKVAGLAAIAEALAGFLALDGEFSIAVDKMIVGHDTAILFSPWSLSAIGLYGGPVALAGCTADVLRRQPDGCWKIAIDSPFGADGA